MNLKPEEISSVIKEQMKRYAAQLQVADVGTVIPLSRWQMVSLVYMVWKMPCRENFLSSPAKYMAWY